MTCPTPDCPRPAMIEQPNGLRLCWGCATRAAGVPIVPPAPPKGRRSSRPEIIWSDAENARLRTLWAKGVRVRDIADKLGRTEDAVSRHAHAIGLPRRRPGPPAAAG